MEFQCKKLWQISNDWLSHLTNCTKPGSCCVQAGTVHSSSVFSFLYSSWALSLCTLTFSFRSMYDISLFGFRQATRKIVDVKFNEKLTFWHCVSNILSQHERDRYNSLSKVRTNVGKGRAWLRSALNERSLERYLSSLICNEELLAQYYDVSAFLRDQEKSYILPTAAAGTFNKSL